MENHFIRTRLFTFFGFLILFNNLSLAQITHQIDLNNLQSTTSIITGEDGNNYTKITLGNLPLNLKVSEPELPVKYVKLIIPNYQKPVSYQVNLVNPESVMLDYPIYPVQEVDNPWDNIPKPPFVGPSNSIYNTNAVYPPEIIRLVDNGFFDGANHIITLEVMPFQYYPEEGNLYIYKSLSFTVNTTSHTYNILEPIQRLVVSL